MERIQNLEKHSEDNRIDSDLIQLLADSLTLIRANLKSRHVTIDTDFPVQSVIATVEPVQFQQIIVNLISNTCDALESQPADKPKNMDQLRENEERILLVTIDSGPRLLIDAENQFFDLFCTSTASGIGMDLTICSDIIKSHTGMITAGDAPNSGARFRFSLPRTKKVSNEKHHDSTRRHRLSG